MPGGSLPALARRDVAISMRPGPTRAIVAGMTTIARSVPPHRVTAVASDGISPLDLGAVAEVFGIDRDIAPGWYEFSVCGQQPGLIPTRGGLHLAVDRDLSEMSAADTVIVLPVTRFMTQRPPTALLDSLAAADARGCRIVSVCVGAFVLAAAGLLDGRQATTHWRYCADLAGSYPAVDVVPDVLYIDAGNVLTSGGVAAGIDLCLHIVRRDFGADIASRLARRLVVGPHRDGGQAQFIEHPVPATTAGPLGLALTWALEHLHQNLTTEDLAKIAGMSTRTFYRHFQDSTGTTPHRWLLTQQVLLARRLLETTQLSIDEVARCCGFGNASTLRKHFARRVTLSPTSYRRSFGDSDTASSRA